MFSSTTAPHHVLPAAIRLRRLSSLCRRLLVGMVALMLLVNVGAAGTVQAREQYVFAIGILVRVDQRTITLGFEGGATETYRIGPTTTFRSQNGDERRLEDLHVSDPILIITAEGDPLAVTIVDGGPMGFHEAGPEDMRGHEGGCGACSAEAVTQPQT